MSNQHEDCNHDPVMYEDLLALEEVNNPAAPIARAILKVEGRLPDETPTPYTSETPEQPAD